MSPASTRLAPAAAGARIPAAAAAGARIPFRTPAHVCCLPPASRACLGAATALLAVHLTGWCQGFSAPGGHPVSAAQLQLRIDPNTATAAELDLLPRVGEKIAANIIAYRESVSGAPAFRTAEDLDRVPRIGPVTVELLRPYLCFPADTNDGPGSPTP